MAERRSSWDDLDDRQERLYHEEQRVFAVGERTIQLAQRPLSTENHSAIENALGLVREITDPLIRLQVIDALSSEIEAERARIITEL